MDDVMTKADPIWNAVIAAQAYGDEAEAYALSEAAEAAASGRLEVAAI